MTKMIKAITPAADPQKGQPEAQVIQLIRTERPIPGLPLGADFFARIPTYTTFEVRRGSPGYAALEVQIGAGKTKELLSLTRQSAR